MAPHLGNLEIIPVIFIFSFVASPLTHLTTSVASALNGRILANTFPSILHLALAHFWQLGYRQFSVFVFRNVDLNY